MKDSGTSPEAIERLVAQGELEAAREALGSVDQSDERFAVARIHLGLREGSLPAGAAQQALIRLMRRDPDWPRAKELYREASSAAYATGQSSASHSHPPPPVRK